MLNLDPNQRPLHPSLQAKLQLLDNLQKGNIQRVRQLAYALSKVGKTNQQLYGKLSMFVEQHKQELKDFDSDNDDQIQPQIVNVDTDFVQDKQWDSDQSVQYESDQEQQQDADKENIVMKSTTKTKQQVKQKDLFREIKNTCQKRSVSSKKFTPTANNTYQFKPSAVVNTKKAVQLKPSNSKAQIHRNSAIGKTKITTQN